MKKFIRSAHLCDLISLAVTLLLFAAVTLCNLFQSSRPTLSESENRTLTPLPAFSMEAAADGTYSSELGLFFSDTFLCRETLVELSRTMDTWKGVPFAVDGMEFAVLIGPTDAPETENEPADTEPAVTGGEAVSDTEPVTEAVTEAVPDTEAVTEAVIEPVTEAVTEPVTERVTEPVTTQPKETEPPVTEPPYERKNADGDEADFFKNGMFIYGDAVYIQTGYYEKYAKKYFAAAKAVGDAAGDGTHVSVLAAPASSMVLDGLPIAKFITKQDGVFRSLEKTASGTVDFVNVYGELYSHKDDYLFYRTDHHWTALGAYYAYRVFAESVGFDPAPLDAFRVKHVRDDYYGTCYSYTKDPRVFDFPDSIDAYYSAKPHTMVIEKTYGTYTYDCCIVDEYTNYMAFIGGDNPCTVINVPENPQDLNILVYKDSFADAFIPFLCEHYGNIVVVDPRYNETPVSELNRQWNFTEILFLNGAVNLSINTWTAMYEKIAK